MEVLCRQSRQFFGCGINDFLMLLKGINRYNSLLDLLLMKREEPVRKVVISNSSDQSDHELVESMIQRKSGKVVSKL